MGKRDKQIEEVGKIALEIEQSGSQIIKGEQSRVAWRKIILEGRKARSLHRDWVVIALVLDLYEKHIHDKSGGAGEYKGDYESFLKALGENMQWIRANDPKLADFIVKHLAKKKTDNKKQLEPLMSLLRIAQQYSTDLMSHPEVHDKIRESLERLNQLGIGKPFIDKVTHYFSLLAGREYNFIKTHVNTDFKELKTRLAEYIARLKAEMQKPENSIKDPVLVKKMDRVAGRTKQNIEDEIELITTMIGNIEKWSLDMSRFHEYADSIRQFMIHVAQEFRDGELIRRIKKSDAVRRLIYYNEEWYYFGNQEYTNRKGKKTIGLLGMVKLGVEHEDTWKDFIEVTQTTKKEAAEIRKRYGDGRRAGMIAGMKQYHQDWRKWETVLNQILNEITSPEYLESVLREVQKDIVAMLSKRSTVLKKELKDENYALKRVLVTRAAELRKQRASAMHDLVKMLEERVKMVQKSEVHITESIMSKVRFQDRILSMIWVAVTARFKYLEKDFMDLAADYYLRKEAENMGFGLSVGEIVKRVALRARSSSEWQDYAISYLDRLADMENPKLGWRILSDIVVPAAHQADSLLIDNQEEMDRIEEGMINSKNELVEIRDLGNMTLNSQKVLLNYIAILYNRHFKGVQPMKTTQTEQMHVQSDYREHDHDIAA